MKSFESLALRSDGRRIELLDQTLLPDEECWIEIRDWREMVIAIERLQVRGAPLIGVAAAACLARLAEDGASMTDFLAAASALRKARPTAVNLMNAIDRIVRAVETAGTVVQSVSVFEEIFSEDVLLCERMAKFGQEVISQNAVLLTHCNTGGLATAGLGTALGVIKAAHGLGKSLHVYVDETRPLLQGSRLTTWELQKAGVDFTLICDNMAGFLMSRKKIDAVLVGADRIALNGDFANKIGTYSLAVLCRHHEVPFYVVAPWTTIDPGCASGMEIPIEERGCDEVIGPRGLKSAATWNPAFDVTPHSLVSGWITDRGLYRPKDIANGVLKSEGEMRE